MSDPATKTATYFFDDIDEIPCEIIDKAIGDTIVKVGDHGDHGYVLWWSDGVANDWTEFYTTLSALLLRLAALVHCGEHGWETGFTVGKPDYWEQHVARRFFTNEEVLR